MKKTEHLRNKFSVCWKSNLRDSFVRLSAYSWRSFQLISMQAFHRLYRVLHRWRGGRLRLTSIIFGFCFNANWLRIIGATFWNFWKSTGCLRIVVGPKQMFFLMEHPIFGYRFGKHSKNKSEFVWSVMFLKSTVLETFPLFANLRV